VPCWLDTVFSGIMASTNYIVQDTSEEDMAVFRPAEALCIHEDINSARIKRVERFIIFPVDRVFEIESDQGSLEDL